MICSPEKLAANRANASLSTGPKTPEGKAVSRANAFKHGLTGDGIVVSDSEIPLIAEVAANLRNTHNPTTTVGLAMIDRAALQLVRLNRAGKVELAIVDDSVLTAVAEFDQFRIDWADDLFNDLDTNPDAIDELQAFPEGIDRLIAEWMSFASVEEWTAENLARLARISEAGRCTPAVIRSIIPGEIARLEDIKAAIDRKPIEIARKRAANLALFPTSREAILARKYEAATERAYHKAMKTFHEAEAAGQPAQAAPSADPAEPLGSFSPAPAPQRVFTTPTKPSPPAVAPVPPEPPVDRPKRPDPQKLRAQMDRKRRR